jgi:RNA polymerase sigma-70 factor (ECF subfamily)
MLSFFRSKSSEQRPDEALLAEYRRSGDTAVLGRLYERYMPMVYGVCLKIFKDSAKAEDAVMTIYEELVRKLPEHDVKEFRPWLYVLARNHCLMAWRKDKRRPTDLLEPEAMQRFDGIDNGIEFELPPAEGSAQPLEKCLGELSEAQRISVQMFYYNDQSYKEIADVLNEELGKVRSYIQNGKRNLKLCLERHGIRAMNDNRI